MSGNGKPANRSGLVKKFLQLNLAREDFRAVKKLTEMFIAKPLAETDLMFRPIMAGIVVTYARSFKSNNGIGLLKEPFISFSDTVLAKTHETLLRCRNGLYAHRDISKSFTTDASNTVELYRLRIRIDTDENLEFAVCSNAPELNPMNLPNVVKLCSLQSGRAQAEIGKLWPVLTNGKKYRPGTYTFGADFP